MSLGVPNISRHGCQRNKSLYSYLGRRMFNNMTKQWNILTPGSFCLTKKSMYIHNTGGSLTEKWEE